MSSNILFLFVALIIGVNSLPVKNSNRADTCGYQTCHAISKDKINVHLLPHSHDDVGWLKTVDQYFYGSRSNIQQAGVQYIISSTVEALLSNPERRFVQVETAFFWKWWKEQSEERRNDFRSLVNNGQIEMINGAWSMNDEACANYQSTIDQFTWGLKIINDTVGSCGVPQIGWQIDPFGHSREQASIFAQLGYNGVFFARLDHVDRETRKTAKNMDFLWQGSANLDNTIIFGNAFPEPLYYPPSGFCWDVTCGDDPIIDDPESFDNNVISRVSDFTKKVDEFSKFYPTNNVLIPMGGDFQYQAAEFNYINMDKLIKALEDSDKYNVFYSTPSCYLKAVNDAQPELTLKVDDFFPYGSDDHSYWGGYFTSRPNSKRYERIGHKILQVAKQIAAVNKIAGEEDHSESLRLLREAMGIMQHHDAITGTEKQSVVQDYVKLLTRAIQTAEAPIGIVPGKLMRKDKTKDVIIEFSSCLLSNISICHTSSLDSFAVVVFNPLSRPVTHHVRLPVTGSAYAVLDGVSSVESEVVDAISDFSYVKLDSTPSPKELVFVAKDIPAMGINLYEIGKTAAVVAPKEVKADDLKFGTDTLGFELDATTNLLKSVTMNGKTIEITQEIMYYDGANGDNNGDNKASGAYIFRPLNGNKPASKLTDSVKLASTTKGPVVDEVKQVYNDWVTQIIRVYKGGNENYIEFDWLVGPINVDETEKIGKEIISRFTVKDFKNDGVFYTDSNGREMIKRTKDKRYDYEYDPTLEPISSNYYPVTSKIVIKDETNKLEVAVLNDRSQGGTSLDQGQVELMVHRRLLKDDAKGVGEPLNEQEFDQGVVTRGQHYLVIGSSESNVKNGKSTAAQERELALKQLLQPWVLVSQNSGRALDNLNSQLRTIEKDLPDNVNILTLEPWNDDTYLLRLEHILEKNEDDTLSQDVTVDLDGLFTYFTIDEIQETTLGGNQLLDDYNGKVKFEWKTKDGSILSNNKEARADAGPLAITLTPMQIRTFIIKAKSV